MMLPFNLRPEELPLLDPVGQILLEEVMLMDKLAAILNVKTVFDVGACVGQWSFFAHHRFNNAIIHAFEPIPDTHDILVENVKPLSRVRPAKRGLSRSTCENFIHHSKQLPSVSSILNNPFIGVPTELALCDMIRADEYMKEFWIEQVDFVKIDTQGMEMQTLVGFGECLEQGKVPIIQFEYTWLSIFSHDLLYDFYQYLGPRGYQIGKLTPQGIAIKKYEHQDEDFKGPYYIAVHDTVKEKLGIP